MTITENENKKDKNKKILVFLVIFLFLTNCVTIFLYFTKRTEVITTQQQLVSTTGLKIELEQKVKEYKEKFANPYVAAARGYVDSVIEPSETRKLLLHAIEVSVQKNVQTPYKKHGIPPF